MAKLYKTNGEVVEITPKNKRKGFTLQECYDHIGCDLIDAQCISNDGDETWFVADDEGLLKDKPILNVKVTAEARRLSGRVKVKTCYALSYKRFEEKILNAKR